MSDEQEQKDTNTNTIDGLENGALPSDDTPDVQRTEELATKVEECKALNDKYLRLAAEFENYKRLTQRDQREQIKFGNEQLLKELLPVVDNMERAIKAARANGGDSALIQGVELTLKQLSGALVKFGIHSIETIGRPFDPNTHQAVSSTPSSTVAVDHIVDEFQKGYKLHDRVLRAAMVSVSSGPPSSSDQETASS